MRQARSWLIDNHHGNYLKKRVSRVNVRGDAERRGSRDRKDIKLT